MSYLAIFLTRNLLLVSEVYIKHFSATSYKLFSFQKTKTNQQPSPSCRSGLPTLPFFFSSPINTEKPLFEKNMKTCYRNPLGKQGVSNQCLFFFFFFRKIPRSGIAGS